MGRNARYSDYHRKRLEAIKALRDDYALPLDEIRRLVNLSDFDEDITLAALPLPPAALPRLEETDTSTALDFMRARQAQGYQQRRARRDDRDPGQRRVRFIGHITRDGGLVLGPARGRARPEFFVGGGGAALSAFLRYHRGV